MMKSIFILLFAFVCFPQIKAQYIFTIAGDDSIGYSRDSILATQAGLDPYAAKIDRYGNLFIADCGNNLIREVLASNHFIYTVAGDTATGIPLGDSGIATHASFFGPSDVALDSAGNIYIADKYNCRVRKVIVSTGIIYTIAGNGTPGFGGDNGMANATTSMLNLPSGLAIDRLGNVYIADAANACIRKITASTGKINTIVTGLNYPNGLAIDTAFNLYIADYGSNYVYKVNKTGFRTIVAGNGTNAFSGDGGPAISASLANPSGVALDNAGNLFISDENNFRIRKVKSMGDSISAADSIFTVAGGGAYIADSVSALKAEFVPFGVAMDSIGTLYIVDNFTYRVRYIDSVGTTVGIQEIRASGIEFKLYPNPNNGKFLVETISRDFNPAKQRLMIFDISGRVLLNEWFNGEASIDASAFAEGVYTIRLISDEGVGNKRIIIVK